MTDCSIYITSYSLFPSFHYRYKISEKSYEIHYDVISKYIQQIIEIVMSTQDIKRLGGFYNSREIQLLLTMKMSIRKQINNTET